MIGNAGELNRRATIQKPAGGTQDGHGDVPLVWSDVATVWCAIIPTAAGESAEEPRVRHTTTFAVTMRYHPDVSPECRLKWFDRGRTRYLQIVGVLDVEEAGGRLELTCVEVT
jgi:head-tail adaptor